MKMIELITHDFLRMKTMSTVILRYDADDFAVLLHEKLFRENAGGGAQVPVLVPRKVEIMNEDGSWSPYPSVVWINNGGESHLLALLKYTDEYINGLCASDGFLEEFRNLFRDALMVSSSKSKRLYEEAERAGVLVETITLTDDCE